MDKQAEIEQLLERMGVTGEIEEVSSLSRPYRGLFYPKFNRCFCVRLSREVNGETITSKPMYVYTGELGEVTSISEAVWDLVDEAEHDGHMETFDRWKVENEEYVHELKMSGAKMWYRYIRRTFNRLSRFFSQEEYEQLARVIWS